jgi:hypothetical protein
MSECPADNEHKPERRKKCWEIDLNDNFMIKISDQLTRIRYAPKVSCMRGLIDFQIGPPLVGIARGEGDKLSPETTSLHGDTRIPSVRDRVYLAQVQAGSTRTRRHEIHLHPTSRSRSAKHSPFSFKLQSDSGIAVYNINAAAEDCATLVRETGTLHFRS